MEIKIVNYPGQKNRPGVIQKIINQVPNHKIMVEPYSGSASVSRYLATQSKALMYLNDIDQTVTDRYVVIGAKVINIDALDLLQTEFLTMATTDTFVFIDPPYLHQTRSSKEVYSYEMSDSQHMEMLDKVLKLKCNVMIIHPECEMYNSILSNWRTVQVKIRYHRKTSIEKLYMNYPDPDIIQSFQFLGSDCWDRQRIKRKGDRLIKKLEGLDTKERNYLLNRIQTELLTT